MRILLTNMVLAEGSGTEALIRDLSLELRRRGHAVICFAPLIGSLAAEIRATGTPVVRSLAAVAEPPDIIHGHHGGPTMMALARFPQAQAVFVCHDWSSVYDDPPVHPRIGRYLYVRHVLRERLVSEKSIPPDQVEFWGRSWPSMSHAQWFARSDSAGRLKSSPCPACALRVQAAPSAPHGFARSRSSVPERPSDGASPTRPAGTCRLPIWIRPRRNVPVVNTTAPATIDIARVGQPKVLPSRPRNAGVYGHLGSIPFLDALDEACAARGIGFLGELTATADRHNVEQMLPRCVLVFASGRMAWEAIAAGCAVINADRFGVGGLVTSARLTEFMAANFAIGALSMPPTHATLVHALDAYDAADAALVTTRIRQDCDIAVGAARLEAIYQTVIAGAAATPVDHQSECLALACYLEENFQQGRLYHGEFVRRSFTPTPESEVHATVLKLRLTVERLSSAVDELAHQTRSLSNARIGSLIRSIFRLVRKRWRLWRSGSIRFKGDIGASRDGPQAATQDR